MKLFSLFSYFIFSLLFGCGNILELLSNKKTDKALLAEVQIALKKKECKKSITSFEGLSEAFRQKKEVQLIESKAHACLCGLDFISLISQLSFDEEGNEEGDEEDKPDNLFTLLMHLFNGATNEQISACVKAKEILLGIENKAQSRSIDENLYFAYLSLTNIGVVLNYSADEDNNKKLDPSFDACKEDEISDDLVLSFGDALAHSFHSFESALTAIERKRNESNESENKSNVEEDFSLISSICKELSEVKNENNINLDTLISCDPSQNNRDPIRISILRIFINTALGVEIKEACLAGLPLEPDLP